MESKCKGITKFIKPTCRWKINRYKKRKRRRAERRKFKKLSNKTHGSSTWDHGLTTNSHISSLVTPKMDTIPVPPTLMGMKGCDWFVENYKLCQTWQHDHQKAVNKSKLAGLEYENEMLHQQLVQLMEENHKLKERTANRPHGSSKEPNHQDELDQNQLSNEEYSDDEQNDEEADDENEVDDEHYEVDGEFRNFFETTMRHRLELKKSREEQEKKDTTEQNENKGAILSLPMKTEEKQELMQRLYGDDGPMIHGMETALELTFVRNCSKNAVSMWPNIPLRDPHKKNVFI